MSEASPVRLERDGDIGVITVNYPPVNALGPGVAEGIIDCLARRQRRPGDQGHGADRRRPQLHRRRRHPRLRHQPPARCRSASASTTCWTRSAKPVVAAIHGYALGGGLEIAHGLPLPHRRAEREGRPAGGADRHPARRRRHAAPAAPDRPEGGARHDRLRPPRAGRRRPGSSASSTRSLPDSADLRDERDRLRHARSPASRPLPRVRDKTDEAAEAGRSRHVRCDAQVDRPPRAQPEGARTTASPRSRPPARCRSTRACQRERNCSPSWRTPTRPRRCATPSSPSARWPSCPTCPTDMRRARDSAPRPWSAPAPWAAASP